MTIIKALQKENKYINIRNKFVKHMRWGGYTMSQLLKDIQKYWTDRAEGYSRVNQEELSTDQKQKWLSELVSHFPKKEPGCIKVLDVGTGPGFFAIILAEAGYSVTAVDYTEEMLKKAKENAGCLAEIIQWRQMDAQNLDFEDNTFDVLVTRNVTWNLENPAKAYKEWHRVLKKGGCLLNFDANWYAYLYDETLKEEYEQDRKNARNAQVEDYYEGTDIDEMERIAAEVPLSKIHRPAWDRQVIREIGFAEVLTDEEAGLRVLSDAEKINYKSTPVFLVKAIK